MSPEDRDELVMRMAAGYKRKYWWADLDELQQIGVQAVLESERPDSKNKFDPRVGVDEGAFLRVVVWRAIQRFCNKNMTLYGGSRTERWNMSRESLESDDGEPTLHCTRPNPEEALDVEQYMKGLRDRMREVCSHVPGALDGLEALLREDRPSSDGVTTFEKRGEEYKKRNKATRCLRGDRKLWMLLKRRED